MRQIVQTPRSLVFSFEPLERRSMLATVAATGETAPIPHGGDSADDAAIWVHPTDPSQSVIIGSDKSGSAGGLAVYDVSGAQLGFHVAGAINGVDLRYNFPLGGLSVDIVAATNRNGSGSLMIYKVNPQTRLLENVAARTLNTAMSGNVYGAALYRSPTSGKFFAFVTSRSGGNVEQWELFDNGAGLIDGAIVRTFNVGSTSEAMVVDDQNRSLFVGEESTAIWKYGAEPDAGVERTQVDNTNAEGHLSADIEGLAIYRAAGGQGYLLASSQGSDDFVIYDRNGTHAYIDRFSIIDGAIDGVTHSDGIDVASVSLGPSFPQGVFVTHDDANPGGNQNFKLVPWTALAGAMSLNVDTSVDPRWVVGDFNKDGWLNVPDVNLLCQQIHAMSPQPAFDLNADDVVNADDLTYLVQTLLFTQFGDTDVDGDVDLADLGALSSHYGQTDAGHWSAGDFDADGDVDLADLGTLASNYGDGVVQAMADFQTLADIPEPSVSIALLGAICFISHRRFARCGLTARATHHGRNAFAV